MRCLACGAANAENATRCGNCGDPLARALPDAPAPQTQVATSDPWPGWGLREEVLLVAYIFISSYFGLTGRFLFFASPLQSIQFMGSVWAASIVADAVFVAGTAATGIAAYRLARRRRVGASILLGVAGTWTTYALSWLLVLAAEGGNFARGAPDLLSLFAFVGAYGIGGLAIAALSPALLAMRDSGAAVETSPAAVEGDGGRSA